MMRTWLGGRSAPSLAMNCQSTSSPFFKSETCLSSSGLNGGNNASRHTATSGQAVGPALHLETVPVYAKWNIGLVVNRDLCWLAPSQNDWASRECECIRQGVLYGDLYRSTGCEPDQRSWHPWFISISRKRISKDSRPVRTPRLPLSGLGFQ
jgi:hypothetical protein